MNWFTDIPKTLQIIMGIIAVIAAFIFLNSLDFSSPNQIDENTNKLTEYVADNATPTEVSWISFLIGKLENHPFLLISSIFFVLWIFGYYLPKKKG